MVRVLVFVRMDHDSGDRYPFKVSLWCVRFDARSRSVLLLALIIVTFELGINKHSLVSVYLITCAL